MPYVVGSVPYFRCFVRREYTQDMQEGHGEFIPAVAYGIRCIRGHSLWFQVMLREPDSGPNSTGGASFFLPIEALVHAPCSPAKDMSHVQPWDVFSSSFGVCEFDFIARGAANILPDRKPAQYRFSIDFTGSDLADDPDQHKCLHVCFLDGGLIGAFPNNRVLWSDPAFWETMTDKPSFKSLSREFRAEGNQNIVGKGPNPVDAKMAVVYPDWPEFHVKHSVKQ